MVSTIKQKMFLILLFAAAFSANFALPTNAYVFDCVDDGCVCNTDDQTIHCENRRPNRVELPLPEKPLYGFSVLDVKNNKNLKVLPTECELLRTFPDLKAVNVEQNPNINCSALASDYKKLQMMSDCEQKTHQAAKLSNCGCATSPPPPPPTTTPTTTTTFDKEYYRYPLSRMAGPTTARKLTMRNSMRRYNNPETRINW